ncbi:hypothetical protein GCM10027073_56220 [Streptomyces chlorus]
MTGALSAGEGVPAGLGEDLLGQFRQGLAQHPGVPLEQGAAQVPAALVQGAKGPGGSAR